jgi:hypothetical protein
MTVLAGADSVVVGTTASGIITNTGALGLPYGTVDTGALAKNTTQYLYAVISFDDGTTGWILGAPLVRNAMTTVNFNSGSAFDEYCSIFSVPFKIRISGVSVEALNIAAATDTFEVILYRDPLGTPIPLVTLAPDQHMVGNASVSSIYMFHIPQTTLESGVMYGVSLRPTSVNNITIAYISLGIVPATIVRAGLQMDNMKVGVRTDQTGAFATTDDLLPVFILDVCGLDDGVAGYLPVVP